MPPPIPNLRHSRAGENPVSPRPYTGEAAANAAG